MQEAHRALPFANRAVRPWLRAAAEPRFSQMATAAARSSTRRFGAAVLKVVSQALAFLGVGIAGSFVNWHRKTWQGEKLGAMGSVLPWHLWRLPPALLAHVAFASEIFAGFGACEDCAQYIIWVLTNRPSVDCPAASPLTKVDLGQVVTKEELHLAYQSLYRDSEGQLNRRPNIGHESTRLKFATLEELDDPSPEAALDALYIVLERHGYARVDLFDPNDEGWNCHNHVFVLWKDRSGRVIIIQAYAFQYGCSLEVFNSGLFAEYLRKKTRKAWDELFHVRSGCAEVRALRVEVSVALAPPAI